MRQYKFNLKGFLPFFILMAVITAMIFNAPPQHVLAQEPTPTPEEEPRIVGGGPASPGDWPWQVALVWGNTSIHYTGNLYNDQFCGGSLIDAQWVLTAAHCITEDNGSISLITGLDVVAGIYDLATGVGYQQRDVAQIIRHPSYNDSTLDNDLALIRLSSPVTLGGVGPTATDIVALASPSNGLFVNASSWVTGWGRIANPTGWDSELYEVNIPVISNAACSQVWGGIVPGNICAGLANGKDACSGDSGGPLVVDVSGTWTLVGIVSSGSGTCGDAPGIYTRVSEYKSWITPYVFPQVTSITRQNINPTNATSVNFIVNFSVPMTGVDSADFSLVTTGSISGEFVSGVSGSGSSYIVTANQGGGEGTIRLDVVDNDSIINSSSSPLGGVGTVDTGNGAFTSGEVYTIKIIASLPSPVLRSPRTGAVLNEDEPTFQWSQIIGAQSYEIEFDNTNNTNNTFNNLDLNSASGITATSYTVASPFSDGPYFWRVRAVNTNGDPGKWSTVRTFTIDTTSPAVPNLISPLGTTTRGIPTFRWGSSASAVLYEFVYDDASDCLSPSYSKTTRGTSIRPPAIPAGPYFWCVRAKDSAGNWSALSASSTFTITP